MALLQNVIARGTHAARPAAGSPGVLYYETDTGRLFRDNGASWDAWDVLSAAGDLLYFDGTNLKRLAIGSAAQVLTVSSGEPAWEAPAAGGSGLYAAYLCYQDQEAQGTQGGTFTSGAWRTRVLNTEAADTGNHGTLASNQITLDAGTYRCQASCPAYGVAQHQARLQNITDSATLLVGSSEYTHTGGDYPQTTSFVVGRFTIAASKVLELQHRCALTQAGEGLGNATNVGTEIYAQLELWKEA